jgi:hypothetical protein
MLLSDLHRKTWPTEARRPLLPPLGCSETQSRQQRPSSQRPTDADFLFLSKPSKARPFGLRWYQWVKRGFAMCRGRREVAGRPGKN